MTAISILIAALGRVGRRTHRDVAAVPRQKEMSEKPIAFSPPMVRAFRAGIKTQTRRILKKAQGPSLSVDYDDEAGEAVLSWLTGPGPGYDVEEEILRVRPAYLPGDRLWVREGYSGPHSMASKPPRDWPQGSPIWYWADGNPEHGDWTKPKPGMFMTRWMAREFGECTEVRVERLQAISETDCIAEGCAGGHGAIPGYAYSATPHEHYAHIWESLNGAGSWALNPWVWVYGLKRVTP